MSEHITLEELFAFVYDGSTGPEARARAARINAHLVHCAACRETCQALLDLRDSAGALAIGAGQPGAADRLLEQAAWFRLRIQDAARKLLLDAVRFGACDFGHPIPVGTRSPGPESGIPGWLVDNENSYNQLIVRNGALRVQLTRRSSSPAPGSAPAGRWHACRHSGDAAERRSVDGRILRCGGRLL